MATRIVVVQNVWLALLLVAAAGCADTGSTPPAGTTGTGASSAAASATMPPSAPPASTPSASATSSGSAGPRAPEPSTRPAHATTGPPAATLIATGARGPFDGSLGSYTWDGSGSDGPWIVAPSALPAGAGTRLSVAFAGTTATAWTAAWARVADGVAGPPERDAAGEGPVAVVAPAAAGDWTIRVTAFFGPGRSAAYYWRVSVAR